MQHGLVDSQLLLSDKYIWHSPHIIQRIHRGELQWDEFLRFLVDDLAFGASERAWIPRLLDEGNIGLACDLATCLGVYDEVKVDCEAQEQLWQDMHNIARVELEDYLRQQGEEIIEGDREECNELLKIADGHIAEQAYGDAVSAVDQARKVLERAVDRRRAMAKAAFEAADNRLRRARDRFISMRQSKFLGGERSYLLAKSLLLKAEDFLLNKDYVQVSQIAEWVEGLCAGHEVPLSQINGLLNTEVVTEAKPVVDVIVVDEAAQQPEERFVFHYPWSRDDDEYLIDNYDVMSNGQLQLRFHASEQEIEQRISHLGLVHDRQSRKRMPWRNPYVAGKPIRDKRVFVGRDDVFEFIRDGLALPMEDGEAGDRNLVALIGHRRTGKTSLLLQLKKNRREILAPRIPIFVDFEGMLPFPGGLKNFFYKLARRVQQELAEEGFELPEPIEDDFKDPALRFQDFLSQAVRVSGGTGLVLMMDEFHAIEPSHSTLGTDVYKMLRFVIQHNTKLDFIIAGTMQMERLMREYHAAMFGSAITKRIDFLEEKDARKLVVGPVRNYVSYTKGAEDLIIEVTASHPYFVQLVCWTLARYLIDRGKSKVFPEDVERVLPQVIEQGVHFDEIWATETTDLELFVMAAIGELAAQRKDWCSLNKIEEKLRSEERMPHNTDDLNEAIGNLVGRRILRYSDNGGAVRFQVAMFGQWVHVNKPFAVVNRDIQVKATQERRRSQRQPMAR